jgi:hypothetical protein
LRPQGRVDPRRLGSAALAREIQYFLFSKDIGFAFL